MRRGVFCVIAGAGIRLDGGGAVDLRLQPRGDAVIGGLVRSWPFGGRHRSRAELPDDLFPHRRAGWCGNGIDRVERELGGSQSLVVAGDAVLI